MNLCLFLCEEEAAETQKAQTLGVKPSVIPSHLKKFAGFVRMTY